MPTDPLSPPPLSAVEIETIRRRFLEAKSRSWHGYCGAVFNEHAADDVEALLRLVALQSQQIQALEKTLIEAYARSDAEHQEMVQVRQEFDSFIDHHRDEVTRLKALAAAGPVSEREQ